MPHLPDDDFAPHPKVLRKRRNGVYREDLGFSGPTRRYVLTVALLAGLASVPTLAILTTGSSEITGGDRPGAMDVPFLPLPSDGPVRPAPLDPAPGSAPASPSPSPPAREYGRDSPKPAPSASAVTSYDPPGSPLPLSSWRPAPPGADTASRPAQPRPGAGPRARPSSREPVVSGGKPSSREPVVSPPVPPRIPVVPDLPVVPEDDHIPDPVWPADFPTVPGLPEIPEESYPERRESDPDDSPRPERGTPEHGGHSDSAHHHHKDHSSTQSSRRRPACENAAPPVRSGRHPNDHPDSSSRPASDPARRAIEPFLSAVHDSRSTDRLRPSRRSAVAERPYNIRPSRILEQSYGGGDLNVVRRLLTDSNSEENRLANRPYHGQHRAEHSNSPEERTASYDRSSRVGRHHAEPNPDAPYINRR